MNLDPTKRFSNRVADYAKFRPRYPEALFDALIERSALTPNALVADVGAGTGISAEPLLRRGFRVIALEPNDAMRAACDEWLGAMPGYRSTAGTAEATGLPAQSVDLIVCAQAFHWFDKIKARAEFTRIVKPGGRCAILFNDRKHDANAFMRELDATITRHSADYKAISHQNLVDEDFAAFFSNDFEVMRFANAQHFDADALIGRFASASYLPARDSAAYPAFERDMRRLFDAHAREDRVVIVYDTMLYLGALHV